MSSLGMYCYYLLWLIGIVMGPFNKKFFIFLCFLVLINV
jgi:hypothetical protein